MCLEGSVTGGWSYFFSNFPHTNNSEVSVSLYGERKIFGVYIVFPHDPPCLEVSPLSQKLEVSSLLFRIVELEFTIEPLILNMLSDYPDSPERSAACIIDLN